MANNTNIALQRLTVETYEDAVTRAFAAFDPTGDRALDDDTSRRAR
jgi:hypothetical protein